MKQWEIYQCDFAVEGPHPIVIFSPTEIANNPDHKVVNALLCTSVRQPREPNLKEVFLDEADGLDWKTAVRCHFIQAIEKSSLRQNRGSVSPARQAAIREKIRALFRLG